MNLSDDDKLLLSIILEESRRTTVHEREQYLRSVDMESQIGTIAAMTRRLMLIDEITAYCNQRAVEG